FGIQIETVSTQQFHLFSLSEDHTSVSVIFYLKKPATTAEWIIGQRCQHRFEILRKFRPNPLFHNLGEEVILFIDVGYHASTQNGFFRKILASCVLIPDLDQQPMV